MLTSLYTAVSGMSANGDSLSVIGDNIANQNTIGFKASDVSFGDILSQSMTGGTGASQIGRGVQMTGVSPLFTQGSFQTSSNGLDLAIDGNGFFMVADPTTAARSYTRAGQFSLDKDGNIVNPDGLRLQGYLANPIGTITGTIGDMAVAAVQNPAIQTANADITVNIDASATAAAAWTYVGGTATPPAAAQYNSTNTVTVYDSQGGAHAVNVYYAKTAANAWTAHYVYTDSTGVYQQAATTQNLTFNTSGALAADNQAATAFVWGGGVANGAITFNYGTSIAEGGTGLDGTTQFNSPFAVLNMVQDGYAAGSLKNILVGQDGIITGVFTNGQTRAIGQVALATFIAPTELTKQGRNLYAESFASGQPIIGGPNTSGLGKVDSNSLELSNVDLANEFVKMIAAQRAFEANSKIITTTDSLLQTLTNLR
jgi:flagellar hook protein FlgE